MCLMRVSFVPKLGPAHTLKSAPPSATEEAMSVALRNSRLPTKGAKHEKAPLETAAAEDARCASPAGTVLSFSGKIAW